MKVGTQFWLKAPATYQSYYTLYRVNRRFALHVGPSQNVSTKRRPKSKGTSQGKNDRCLATIGLLFTK